MEIDPIDEIPSTSGEAPALRVDARAPLDSVGSTTRSLSDRQTCRSATATRRRSRIDLMRSRSSRSRPSSAPRAAASRRCCAASTGMNDLIDDVADRGRHPARRSRHLRPGASTSIALRKPHRHGVPEVEPVPEVDLRERRLRAAHPRHRAASASSTRSWSGACAAPRSGTRSRTASHESALGAVGRPAAAPVHRARASPSSPR